MNRAASPDDRHLQTLTAIGFSEMEAVSYCALLRMPGATGYRLAKAIGKAHANVYQALGTLEAKGAVIVEEAESRAYRAVPPSELIQALKARYDASCADAEAALASFEQDVPQEDRFYRLSNRDQVVTRARRMIAEATSSIVFQCMPAPAALFRDDLAAAHGRGVGIAGLVFDEADLIPGSKLAISHVAERLLRIARRDQLTLIVDASQFLLAQFDRDDGEVRRAVWVNSPYVSALMHNGVSSDVILHGLPVMKEIVSPQKHLFGDFPPGVKWLFES